ncbi:unnamed protein product [Didymodactylos carnosus]|uniref:Uncharacterized protein n=1 Tax=Didymodactylos carnosus TaxID=1234261 RepID=A0A815DZQ7_9BILA|nr:unnamed protein product [Didymodactylos carnosus]CAF4137733.1 unnamed protein product [Didymodactylos carnosus]
MNKMDVIQVAQYESDTSDEEVVEENDEVNGNEKIIKKKKFWIKEATFDKPGETESLIGNKWSKHYTHDTENGRTVYYRCNNVKRRGPQYSASIYLLYHTDTDKVTLYKTEADHDHHDDKCRGIDEKKIMYDDEDDEDTEDDGENKFCIFLS